MLGHLPERGEVGGPGGAAAGSGLGCRQREAQADAVSPDRRLGSPGTAGRELPERVSWIVTVG